MAKAAHWMELDDKRKAKEGDGVGDGAGAAAASGTVDPAAVALLRQVCEQRHLFHVVLSFGTVADLCRWRAVNTSWRSAATESDLWAPRCKRLWADKVYVAPRARDACVGKVDWWTATFLCENIGQCEALWMDRDYGLVRMPKRLRKSALRKSP